MFLQSLKTIRNSSKDNITYLSRNMESIHEVYNHEKKKSSYQSSLFSYAKDYINIHIVNHKSYVKILKELKNLNSSSNLIVYTTPVSADHFAMKMKSMDKYALYSQWIKTLEDIFGEIARRCNRIQR